MHFRLLFVVLGGERAEIFVVFAPLEKPQLSLAPQNRTVVEGANASFGCGGEGYPTPEYRWTKAHPSSSNFQPHNESHFTIAPVSPSDAGQYTCNIFNKAGSIAVSAWLRVECELVREIYIFVLLIDLRRHPADECRRV